MNDPNRSACTRRSFLKAAGVAALCPFAAHAAPQTAAPWFLTRGVVLGVRDMETYDWPALAKAAGLTTLATHITPSEIAAFVKTEAGQRFLEGCKAHGIAVEHELHALGDLLPRDLFDKDPSMFRMNEQGERVREYNLCVHSKTALNIVAENAVSYVQALPSTTGRYFFWIDDAMPMCRCPECRAFSDCDQALLFENHILGAIRQIDTKATLAHLAYVNTLDPPTQVKPDPGIFLEFAPIERRYDVPFRQRDAIGTPATVTHGRLLDALDANLEYFGKDNAQALEYWLDVSRFSSWKRDRIAEIPWNDAAYRDDLELYSSRGIRHVTTFGVWIDADYVKRWGTSPIEAYGRELSRWSLREGAPALNE